MKVQQFPYLSPDAMRLRERDGTPPWGLHPCELDSFHGLLAGASATWSQAVADARGLREAIEAEPAGLPVRRRARAKKT